MWPGMALSIEVEKVLFSGRTRYQDVQVYQTKTSGKMLVIDGIIQLTEADEFAYHEMLTHTPLFAHPDPRRILVIGGGDGGVLREAVRHPGIETIDICEIDEEVMKISRKFLPFTSLGFDDPRVMVHVMDGNEFIKTCENIYDVIIVDSTDPIGPGKALFTRPFYENLKSALNRNGLIAAQGESFFLHEDYVKDLVNTARSLFPIQAYSYILVPTYPGGHIGICFGSMGPKPGQPNRPVSEDLLKQLKYYTPRIHGASFVLPAFAEKMLGKS